MQLQFYDFSLFIYIFPLSIFNFQSQILSVRKNINALFYELPRTVFLLSFLPGATPRAIDMLPLQGRKTSGSDNILLPSTAFFCFFA